MSPTSEPLVLPLPLLLLVHLYILQYPRANDVEYDHNIFNPRVRGLRDRTRTMEDIAFFLVGRIEGKGIKTILSTYPCRQPSESLCFRTSLTKYLEQIRHRAVYPTRSNGDATDKVTAPWWKEVMVRKSLLEECAGDKFERLILSLSTHALMKALCPIPFETLSTRLRSQPLLYSAAIARYNPILHAWARSASLLIKWENDLKLLRVRLHSHPQSCSTKYDCLPTSRLKALAQSKLEDLADLHWTSDEARSALSALMELSGLRLLTSDADKGVMPPSQSLRDNNLPTIQPSPLPVAAARHPSYLKKLKRPVLQRPKSNVNTTTPLPTKTHAEIILAVQIDAARRMQQLLADAISRSKKRQIALQHAVGSRAQRTESDSATPFWEFPLNNFEMSYNPEPDKDLLMLAGLERDFVILHPDTEGTNPLERRIDEIRSRVLAPYPAPPDPTAPRLPPQETTLRASRIPQPKPVTAPKKETAALASDPHPPQRLAVPLKNSPASTRRKSVRFSTAGRRTGRPSMFRVFSKLDDDVDLLVDQTHDFPTDDDDTDHEGPVTYSTPKAKRKTRIVNRIWTAGTPSSRMKATPRPRSSEVNALRRLFDAEPVVELPTLGSSTSSLFSEEYLRLEDAGERVDADATPMPKRHPRTVSSSASSEEVVCNGSPDGFYAEDEDDFFVDDPPSMTLKELLLSADSGQFNLLEDDNDEPLASDFLEEDGSFAWE